MNKCKYCGKPVRNKYCNVSCQNRHQNKDRAKKLIEKRHGKILEFSVMCNKCKSTFVVHEREYQHPKKEKYFCSRSCANSHRVTKKQKEKTSKSLLEYYSKIPKKPRKPAKKKYKHVCEHCGVVFNSVNKIQKLCSLRCAGKKSATLQSKRRRSKNEKYFASLCFEYFDRIKTNEPMFNGWDADIIIDDIKVAVLWNGKWHYEKITEKHSVKQVQNRDKIKILEIKKMGYIPYVIKDMGKHDKAFVQKEFKKFLRRFI